MKSQKLAIVIPAYKATFMVKSLNSIANQACKEFTLYIGDDNSPDDLENIVNDYRHKINLVYHKFNDNLGQKSLTKQWERSIALSTHEEYIWLFSDDDEMPVDAVERFYNEISKRDFDILRYNLQFIDENNHVIRSPSNHPDVETSSEFIQRRLRFLTISAGCEYIFSRKVFEKNQGFIDFPYAWCSDDATWATYGKTDGIKTIPGTPISMRLANGVNISSNNALNSLKFISVINYALWLKNKNEYNIPEQLLTKYLISQARALGISRTLRLHHANSLLKIQGIKTTIALIINKAAVYRILVPYV
jgi:glycosyltransferase involved in cell wall biosynthesis